MLINRDGERKPVSSAIRSKQENKIYDYYGAAGVIDKVDAYIFDERLLLIGEDGANLLSRSKDNAFFAEGKYWVNNHAHVLDATNKLLLDYVAIVINAMKLDDYVTGSAQPKLSQDNLNKIPIFLPPLEEQIRILVEMKHWFTLIDLMEQGKTDLQVAIKRAKSKILDIAIHGKLVPQDPNDEPASELLKRINPNAEITCDNGHYENLLFEVPQNWSWSTLCEITDFIRNGAQIKQVKGATGIPITRIETISNSELDLTRMGYSDIFNEDEYSNYYLQDGDILMSHINSRTHVGKCALCRNIPYKIIHGMNLLRICLKKEILPEYISLFFRTNIFYTQIEPYIKNAVNQASINITNLRKTLIPIPPLAEQKRIVDSVNKTFAKLDAIMDSL